MATTPSYIDSLPPEEQPGARAWAEGESETPLSQAIAMNAKIDLAKELMDVLYKTDGGKLFTSFLNNLYTTETQIDFSFLRDGDTVKLVAEKCGKIDILDEIHSFINNQKRLAAQEKIVIPDAPKP